MSQDAIELRNIVLLITKRLGALDEKVNRTYTIAKRAEQYSSVAKDMSMQVFQGHFQDLEMDKIRNLFSGASPCLEEVLVQKKEDHDMDGMDGIDELFSSRGRNRKDRRSVARSESDYPARRNSPVSSPASSRASSPTSSSSSELSVT